MDTTSTLERLDEVMEIACRLAGRDTIGGIHVAIDERPTYEQLLHYRELAAEYGLALTMTANRIVFRPLPVPDALPAERPSGRARLRHMIAAVGATRGWATLKHWWHDPAWNAGFPGLGEGTR